MVYKLNLSGYELSTLHGTLAISIQHVEKMSLDLQAQLDDCPNPSDYRILLDMSVSANHRLNDMRSILAQVESLS